MDNNGKVIKDQPAETLQKQYSSVWSQPKDFLKIRNMEYFIVMSSVEGPKLEYVSITKMKIKKAISRLKNGASPGPDGATPEILINFCDQLLDPLEIIFQNSMDTSIFPDI